MFLSSSTLIALILGFNAVEAVLPQVFPQSCTKGELINKNIEAQWVNPVGAITIGHPVFNNGFPQDPIHPDECRLALRNFAHINHAVTSSLPLYNSAQKFRDHTPSFFSENVFADNQLNVILRSMFSTKTNVELFGKGVETKISLFAAEITEQDVRMNNTRCDQFSYFFPFMKSTVKDAYVESCAAAIDNLINNRNQDFKRHIHRLPMSYLELKSAEIVNMVERYDASGNLKLFRPEQLSKLLGNSENFVGACAYINAFSLDKLDEQRARSVSGKCFAEITTNITNAQMTPTKMKTFPHDIFADVNQKISVQFFRSMSKEQIELFGSRVPVEERGKYFNIAEIPDSMLTYIPKQLFFSVLANTESGNGILRDRIKLLNKEVFENLSETETGLLKKLTSDEVKGLDPKKLSVLLVNEAACGSLAETDLENLKNNVAGISSTCFARLKPRLQVSILVSNANQLSDNILSEVTDKMVSDWYLYKNGAFQGLELLKVVPPAKAASMVKDLSLKVENDYNHACRSIKSFDALEKIPVLLNNMSESCFKNLEFTIEEKHFLKHSRLSFLRPISEIFENTKDEDWKKMDKKEFATLVERKEFCKSIPESLFKNVIAKSDEKLSAIDSTCYSQLTFRNSLDSTIIPKLGDNAFALAEKTDTIRVSDLTDAQFGNLSKDVPSADRSFLNTLRMKDFVNMSAARIARLDKKQFSHLDNDAFLGLDVTAVEPEKMTNWTHDQVRNINPAHIYKLSAAQIEKIGSDYKKDDKNSSLAYLKTLADKMIPEARAAIEKRLESGASALISVPIIALVVAAMTFLL